MARYRIRQTSWSQEGLRYRELLEAMEILRGPLVGFNGDEQGLGDLMDKMAKEKTLPRLVAILLHPGARTPVGRMIERRRKRKMGMTQENICEHMTAPEIARVLLDFFVLNVSWISNLMPSATGSFSTGAAGLLQIEAVRSRLRSAFSIWRGGTSASPTSTATQTP